jgi:hypothetical protein
VATLLLLDIKGAFDAIIHQWLLSHLRLQGWDNSLIQLIQDWLSSYSVLVQIGDAIATDLIKGGLPQESLLSPILFLLYAAIVVAAYKIFFNYADDLGYCLLATPLKRPLSNLLKPTSQLLLLG